MKTPQWRLKTGMDRRFRSGHPWVYSNELMESPKGIEPGALIELTDAGGKFLARGYGNPHSLIAFRVLSRDESVGDPMAAEAFTKTLHRANAYREKLGLTQFSHRLCYGEGDSVPGLIIDRFISGKKTIFVAQAHTAGANRLLKHLPEALASIVGGSGKFSLVIKNNLGIRKLEGLEEEKPRVEINEAGLDLSHISVGVTSAWNRAESMAFEVDLIDGQKTGFFLDQSYNVALASQLLRGIQKERVRILDLCSYVGQWSAQLSNAFVKSGVKADVTAVDSSAKALEFAQKNVQKSGVSFTALKGDVLRDLETLDEGTYDIIISDPPALIQGRKDIPAGTRAYLQLNTQVFRLLGKGGAAIACSCSALLEEESFLTQLTKAASRNTRSVRWAARGSQAPDHPLLAEFPEGRYLKCFVGLS